MDNRTVTLSESCGYQDAKKKSSSDLRLPGHVHQRWRTIHIRIRQRSDWWPSVRTHRPAVGAHWPVSRAHRPVIRVWVGQWSFGWKRRRRVRWRVPYGAISSCCGRAVLFTTKPWGSGCRNERPIRTAVGKVHLPRGTRSLLFLRLHGLWILIRRHHSKFFCVINGWQAMTTHAGGGR